MSDLSLVFTLLAAVLFPIGVFIRNLPSLSKNLNTERYHFLLTFPLVAEVILLVINWLFNGNIDFENTIFMIAFIFQYVINYCISDYTFKNGNLFLLKKENNVFAKATIIMLMFLVFMVGIYFNLVSLVATEFFSVESF